MVQWFRTNKLRVFDRVGVEFLPLKYTLIELEGIIFEGEAEEMPGNQDKICM